MKKFLTDVDGVVLWWSDSYIRFLQRKYKGFKPKNNFYVDSTDLSWLNREEADKLIDEFHVSVEFSELPAFADAVSVIPKLHKKGWSFVAITSIGDLPETVELRRQNLDRLFPGMFSELVCTPVGVSKLEYLKKYEPTYWVDDHGKHTLAGEEAGHQSFHMVREGDFRPKNERNVVTNWHEIYETLY